MDYLRLLYRTNSFATPDAAETKNENVLAGYAMKNRVKSLN